MKIFVELTKEESHGLSVLAEMCGLSPEAMLVQFVTDSVEPPLDSGALSSGKKARRSAREYIMRCNYSGPLHKRSEGDPNLQPPVEYPLHSGIDFIPHPERIVLSLEVLGLEHMLLHEIAAKCGVKVRDILEQFVADLTYSNRTGGSDERLYAEEYMMRCKYARGLLRTYFDKSEREALITISEDHGRRSAALQRSGLFRDDPWRIQKSPIHAAIELLPIKKQKHHSMKSITLSAGQARHHFSGLFEHSVTRPV